MLGAWIDYSYGRVSGATMAKAGITGAIRYVGIGSAGKRLTRAEYVDLVRSGRQVAAVVELLTTDADAGAAAGVANARAAVADLAMITAGLPPIKCVLIANDKPGWITADVDYVRAAANILQSAGYIVGPYGFGSFIAACRASGCAPIAWQAGPAPSRTGTASLATWWQRQGGAVSAADGPSTPVTIVLDGVTCDLSNQLLPLEVPVTDPNVAGFLWLGGPSTQSASPGHMPTGVDETSIFGRLVDVQGALGSLMTQVADVATAIRATDADVQAGAQAVDKDLQAALAQLLAAIKAENTAEVSPDALQAALTAANVPQGIISAIAAAFAKASTP